MGKQSKRKFTGGNSPAETPAVGEDQAPGLLTPDLLRDATVVVLTALAVLSWIGAHSIESWAGASGIIFVLSSLVLGVLQPIVGLVLAILIVPYQGGTIGGFVGIYGMTEVQRAAPIWGGVIRTLIDTARGKGSGDPPPKSLVFGVIAALLLAPISRLPSEAYPAYQAGTTGIIIDMLAIIGTQSVLWGAWILATHLPRRHIPTIEHAIAIALPIAMLIALASYFRVDLFDSFAFIGTKFGRLAGLGFPTPTAMGIAVALPVAATIAWRTSKGLGVAVLGVALLTVYLTQSRGPLIAIIGSGITALIIYRNTSVRLIVLGAAAGSVAAAALIVRRYGALFSDLLAGKSVDLLGASDSTRIASWIAAFQIAIQKPLTGAGWMSLRFWDPLFDKNGVAESHNIILVALAAGGLPYGISTAVGVIGSAVLMVRNRHKIPVHWVAAATALLICGIWDMPQTRALAALYGGLALGFVARRPQPAAAEA